MTHLFIILTLLFSFFGCAQNRPKKPAPMGQRGYSEEVESSFRSIEETKAIERYRQLRERQSKRAELAKQKAQKEVEAELSEIDNAGHNESATPKTKPNTKAQAAAKKALAKKQAMLKKMAKQKAKKAAAKSRVVEPVAPPRPEQTQDVSEAPTPSTPSPEPTAPVIAEPVAPIPSPTPIPMPTLEPTPMLPAPSTTGEANPVPGPEATPTTPEASAAAPKQITQGQQEVQMEMDQNLTYYCMRHRQNPRFKKPQACKLHTKTVKANCQAQFGLSRKTISCVKERLKR